MPSSRRAPLRDETCLLLDAEGVREPLERFAQRRLGLVGEVARVADRLVDRALRAQRLAQLLLEPRHLRYGDRIEEAVDAGVDRDHLLFDGPRLVLRLVQ